MTKRGLLLIVLGVALACRIGMGVFLGFDSGPDQAACGADTVEFEHMAWSAACGNGFRLYDGGGLTAFRAPGYPLFLAGLYRVFGHKYRVNRIALSLLGVATVLLTYWLALVMGLSEWSALGVALLTALLPLQFYWCGHFMSEPLAAFLNTAAVLAVVLAEKRGSRFLFFVAGVLCGMAGLTRPALLLFCPALVGVWLMIGLRGGKWHEIVLRTVLLALGALLVVVPWTWRNYRVFGRVALISTNGGSTFWGANNDLVAGPGGLWGCWISTTRIDPELKRREVWSLPNEVDRDRREWELGRNWVFNHKSALPLLLTGKLWRLMDPFPQSANKVYVVVSALGWILLLPLLLMGLLVLLAGFSRGGLGVWLPLLAQLAALLMTTLIFYGSDRFRMPYEPVMAVIGMLGVEWVLNSCFVRRGGKSGENSV